MMNNYGAGDTFQMERWSEDGITSKVNFEYPGCSDTVQCEECSEPTKHDPEPLFLFGTHIREAIGIAKHWMAGRKAL